MSGMPRTVSFSELHYKLVTSLCKTYRLGFSEVVRRLIDSGLDHDATLGLSFHEERLKALQIESATVEATIEKLKAEAATSPKVFGIVTNQFTRDSSKASPQAPFTDNRPGLTEEERFLKAAPYVANGDEVVTSEMKTRILAHARKHPEWLDKLPEPERKKLQAMLKIPKIGGRG